MYLIALDSVSLSNFLLFCSKLAKSEVIAAAAIQVTIFAAKKRHLLEKRESFFFSPSGQTFFVLLMSTLFCLRHSIVRSLFRF